MSLQSLISGSECAVPSPLTQILKHADGDHSLQRDRVGPASSSSLHHLPSTSRSIHDADIALARNFFNPAAGPSLTTPSFTPTSIAHIPSPALHANHAQERFGGEFSKWQRERSFVPPPESSWARQFEANISPNVQTSMRSPTVEMGQQYSNQAFMNRPIMPGPSYMPSLSPGTWDQQFSALDTGKGKGKAVDLDFDAAFAAAESQARIVEVKEDTPEALEEVLSRTSLGEETSTAQPKNSDFQDVWDQLRNSAVPPPKSDLAKWEAEYNALMQAERDELEYDYADDMERAWRQASRGEDDTESGFGLSRPPYFDEDGIPDLAPYVFEPNNPHAQSQTPGHLEAAKMMISQGGSLTEAALLLEAAIQANELGKGGYEAWILLGEVRGMDEREDAGLRALREGVRRASELDGGANADGLLSLAISYTNESFDRASQSTLMQWLRISYPSLVNVTKAAPSPWAHHEEVTSAFLSVARAQHAQGAPIDADLQVGLGVLFYTNGEYEKAADCFRSALSVRPTDWLLWNRLGSCLSNGSKPEEALGAYREALQLRPTYTRAIYNVGVACLNIGAEKEAAEHFLSALSLQGVDDGGNKHATKSEQLWITLRRTFASMDRDDLAEKAREGTPLDVFRAEGFDF